MKASRYGREHQPARRPLPYTGSPFRCASDPLYKLINAEQADALRRALSTGRRSSEEAADVLAAACMRCCAGTGGGWRAVGAAPSGSGEMGAVHRGLVDGHVRLFASVLGPHSTLPPAEPRRRRVGLVGAGGALSAAMVRGGCGEAEAAEALGSLIKGGLRARLPPPPGAGDVR